MKVPSYFLQDLEGGGEIHQYYLIIDKKVKYSIDATQTDTLQTICHDW